MVIWSAHFCTNKTNLKTYSVKLTHEMTPETIHCYCIRLALLLFFKGLEINILCVPHWCVSDPSKDEHANSNLNIQNVNISQVPIILHSCRPTLLTINLISVPRGTSCIFLWTYSFILFFSEWFYLMFLFFTNQELTSGAITFIQVPYQYKLLCYFLSYKRNMGKDWCWNWRGKRNPWTTKRGNPL